MKNFRDTRAKTGHSASKVYKVKASREDQEKRAQETIDHMRLKAQSIKARDVKKKKQRQ